MKACIKLRRQHSLASGIYVFLTTNPFKQQECFYHNACSSYFLSPTADTGHIIQVAKGCLNRLFRKGYQYHKVGVMLLDLIPNQIKQYDWLQEEEKTTQAMSLIDHINDKFGRNTVFFGAESIDKEWSTQSHYHSPRYTTQWEELVEAKCAHLS